MSTRGYASNRMANFVIFVEECALAFLFVVSAILAPLPAFADQGAALHRYVGAGGAIGDPLPEALESRANQTGEKFIVTPRAFQKEREAGTGPLLDYLTKTAVIRGWTIIYLPDDDLSEIEHRTKDNLRVWEPALAGRSLSQSLRFLSLPGIDISVIDTIFSDSCGTKKLDIKLPKIGYLFFYAPKGVPNDKLCRDYMLILAVHGISVKQENGHFIAELVENNKKSESKK